MNYQEVERVLAAAMQVDDRMTVDKFRVAAWVEILDTDMPYEFAIQAVKQHYADETFTIMPAHLNRIWRTRIRQQSEKNALTDVLAAPRPELSPTVQSLIEELRLKFTATTDKKDD